MGPQAPQLALSVCGSRQTPPHTIRPAPQETRLDSGDTVLAHVPSHHDHRIGERIGIRAEVDHVVTFNRACPLGDEAICRMPCEHSTRPAALTASGQVVTLVRKHSVAAG